MRIVFAGTPEFARVALQALIDAGHEIPLVLTQPDRPAGRGMKLQASPVKQCALEHDIPVQQPRSLRLDGKFAEDAAAARDALQAARPDAMVVAAYGLILPQWVLDLPKFGCLNIHASLLPRWRGAAPIHRAIEAGDQETGVTIMQMDAGLDTGAMLLVAKLPIDADETTGSLHDKLAAMGARLINEALVKIERGELQAVLQPEAGVNYAHKIEKSEAQIDWTQDALLIARRIRAFDPAPGATTVVQGPSGAETLKIWRAHAQSTHSSKPPGTVLTTEGDVLRVQCGQGVLCITELQRAGGKRLAAADFLRGDKSAVLAAGTVLGQAA